ncbi:hypothetical protein LJR230_000769 [Trinickia sp. LjRoot230]|uniref:hypothetical protein n=1 Tax=Trinickia sp. LjRoot230 TaxID=3342288 RepID=UPI003ED16A96
MRATPPPSPNNDENAPVLPEALPDTGSGAQHSGKANLPNEGSILGPLGGGAKAFAGTPSVRPPSVAHPLMESPRIRDFSKAQEIRNALIKLLSKSNGAIAVGLDGRADEDIFNAVAEIADTMVDRGKRITIFTMPSVSSALANAIVTIRRGLLEKITIEELASGLTLDGAENSAYATAKKRGCELMVKVHTPPEGNRLISAQNAVLDVLEALHTPRRGPTTPQPKPVPKDFLRRDKGDKGDEGKAGESRPQDLSRSFVSYEDDGSVWRVPVNGDGRYIVEPPRLDHRDDDGRST